MWMIWKEQNKRAFEDIEQSTCELKFIFLQVLFEWMTVLPWHSFSSFLDFTDFVLLYTACVWTGTFSFDLIKFFFIALKKKIQSYGKTLCLKDFLFGFFTICCLRVGKS